MTVHIGLLRGVNVGGRTQVAMADLRAMMAELGLGEARTLLQSGNVVFRSSRRKGAALERALEVGASDRLGLRTDFFVRTATQWDAIVAANPFPDEAERDPSHLVMMALKDPAEAKALKALRAAISGPEVIAAEGRQLYIVVSRRNRPLAAHPWPDRGQARDAGDRPQLEHRAQARRARARQVVAKKSMPYDRSLIVGVRP